MKCPKWGSLYKLPMVVLTMGILVFLVINLPNKDELPVLGAQDFSPELVDAQLENSKSEHLVSDFKLINQNGKTITQDTYANKIYVTDFFFTRCPSICPIMSNHMEELQETFRNNDDVMFLSMSVTPELDSVPVLKKYAERHGAIDSKWNITTGDKSHIYNLARKSYFAVVDYGDGGLQDFIHTPNFVLVDQQKQIRGVYNGTATDDIELLKKDIVSLLQ